MTNHQMQLYVVWNPNYLSHVLLANDIDKVVIMISNLMGIKNMCDICICTYMYVHIHNLKFVKVLYSMLQNNGTKNSIIKSILKSFNVNTFLAMYFRVINIPIVQMKYINHYFKSGNICRIYIICPS